MLAGVVLVIYSATTLDVLERYQNDISVRLVPMFYCCTRQ
jgi:hypothetical protein